MDKARQTGERLHTTQSSNFQYFTFFTGIKDFYCGDAGIGVYINRSRSGSTQSVTATKEQYKNEIPFLYAQETNISFLLSVLCKSGMIELSLALKALRMKQGGIKFVKRYL